MVKFFLSLLLSLSLGASLSAQTMPKGTEAENILYYAEVSNSNRPVDTTAENTADPGTGTFTRISKHQDYGLTITRLVVDLGEGSVVTKKDLTEGLFEVLGTNKSDKVTRNIKALSVTDNKGYDVASGRYVTIDLDFGFDSDTDNAYVYSVTLNRDLGQYLKGTEFVQKGRTLRR